MKIFRLAIWMGFIFTALWTFTSLEKAKANKSGFCSGQAGGTVPICENGNTDDCCPPGPYLQSCSCMYCEHPVDYNYMLCTCPPAPGTTWCYFNKIYNWQWEQGYECYQSAITNNKGILYCGTTQAAEAGQLPNCDPPTTCSLVTSMTKKPPPSNKNSKKVQVK